MKYKRDDLPKCPSKANRHTIKSLRLDVAAARAGKTWKLLPEGFRDRRDGLIYPLPSSRKELLEISMIERGPFSKNRDCGCHYIIRAEKAYKKKMEKTNSAANEMSYRGEKIARAHYRYTEEIKKLKAEANLAVDQVRIEASKAVANLNDLFALGRQGLEGQMKAHLEGGAWPHLADCTPEKCAEGCKAEAIDAKAFRECFRMVTTAVKGLGLPSDQKKPATDAVIEQLAESLRDTQEALALSASEQEDEPVN